VERLLMPADPGRDDGAVRRPPAEAPARGRPLDRAGAAIAAVGKLREARDHPW
jgi:hypothetical protein